MEHKPNSLEATIKGILTEENKSLDEAKSGKFDKFFDKEWESFSKEDYVAMLDRISFSIDMMRAGSPKASASFLKSTKLIDSAKDILQKTEF